MSYGHSKDDFVVKDSGKRQEYESGMRRDTQDGKPDYELIDIGFLTRLAEHMTKGAQKYGEDNWRKANSPEEARRFRKSAFRHLMQYLRGDREEDHASAVVFNLMAAEYVREKLGVYETLNEEKIESSPLQHFADHLEELLDARFDSDISFMIFTERDYIIIEFHWLEGEETKKYAVCMNDVETVATAESIELVDELVKTVKTMAANRTEMLEKASALLFDRLGIYLPKFVSKVDVVVKPQWGLETIVVFADRHNGNLKRFSYFIGSLDAQAMLSTPELLDYHCNAINRRLQQALY